MSATLERSETKPVTRRSVFIFRFASTLVLWSVALLIIFSGYELAFFGLIGVVGLIALWEFYGMLDHKGLPNFKVTAMICGAVMLVGSFYYFAKFGPARSYDFEVAVLLFFADRFHPRQMFESLRDDAPLRTMAYTLFGLLYVLWLYNFITKIVYVTPRAERSGDRPVLRFFLHRDHEIQRHGRVSDRQFDRTSSVDSAHQPEENLGRIFRRAGVFAPREHRPFRPHAGTPLGADLDACRHARVAPPGSPRSSAISRNRS